MIAMRVTSEATVYVPPADEITRACAAYRAGWSPLEQDSRLTDAVNRQVELMASILKPMAFEAGLIHAPSVASAATEKPKTVPAVETVSSDDTLCDSAA